MTDKSYPNYACHVELFDGEKPDDCVVNNDDNMGCIYAYTKSGMKRTTPNGCKYWKKNRHD